MEEQCKGGTCDGGCGGGAQATHQQKQAQQDQAVSASLKRIQNKFLVMSGKGGVGKTSVSVNLAMALAKKGHKVGIMDVDIHGPDVPRMLGLTGMLGLNANQKLKPISYSENLSAVSIESLSASKDDAIIWRGPIKHSVIRQFIADVEWGDLDYLIIDSPPGTGDEPLSVAQVISDAQAIIVTTPQEVALADVRKSINFCKTVKMEIFGVIENMSGFECPHCGKAVDIFGAGGGERTAAAMGLNFLGRIPLDPRMVVAGDTGNAYQEQYADSPVTGAFSSLAERMTHMVKKEEAGEQVATPPEQVKKDKNAMKIAIPMANGKLTAHFGHCQEFAILDVNNKEIVNKEVVEPPPHEPGVLPKWLADKGATVVIAGGMGARAIGLFEERGIEVIVGAPAEAPEKLVNDYLNDSLVTGGNVCDH